MAELRIIIPDAKVQLVLKAYAAERGIEPTPQAFKEEIKRDIKHTVKQYKLKRFRDGQEQSISQADIDLEDME